MMAVFAGLQDWQTVPHSSATDYLWLLIAWVGHSYLWTVSLNVLYGLPIWKPILKLYRLFVGVLILAFPVGFLGLIDWFVVIGLYFPLCLVAGGFLFPAVTLARLVRPKPSALVAESIETRDFGVELGPAAMGDGKHRWATRLPFNCVFRVDFTHQTLAIPRLPAAWEGLTVLVLSDLHFHGTPSRAFFEAVLDRLRQDPPPDLILLAGDFVDTDEHHTWIEPLLGSWPATEGRFAVLGNHDRPHAPDRVRAELTRSGYTILSNCWQVVRIRGVEAVLIGHEGPWFRPGPDLATAPTDLFRLCLSHTPDNFPWGQAHGIDWMVAGHVHGGQIRMPLIGSIFVPSVYSRRYDQGVFEHGTSVLTVSRGLSGKEPFRFRCHPQVLRLTLTRRAPNEPR